MRQWVVFFILLLGQTTYCEAPPQKDDAKALTGAIQESIGAGRWESPTSTSILARLGKNDRFTLTSERTLEREGIRITTGTLQVERRLVHQGEVIAVFNPEKWFVATWEAIPDGGGRLLAWQEEDPQPIRPFAVEYPTEMNLFYSQPEPSPVMSPEARTRHLHEAFRAVQYIRCREDYAQACQVMLRSPLTAVYRPSRVFMAKALLMCGEFAAAWSWISDLEPETNEERLLKDYARTEGTPQ